MRRGREICGAPKAQRSSNEDEHPGCRVARDDGGALASRRASARAIIKGATCAAATRRHRTRPAALEVADVRRHRQARETERAMTDNASEARRGEARKERVSNAVVTRAGTWGNTVFHGLS